MKEEADRADLPPDRVTALWRRMKDHRIAQWTVGYVAVAYGIQHAVTLTSEAFDWPHTVTRISMLLLVLGVPLAMTFAWYHGERTTRRISAGEMTTASLLLVLISLVFYVFVRPAVEHTAAAPITSRQSGVAAARTAAADPHGAISLAVLPFANMSGDASQEFFSDGMTEEITAALAKVPDLRVVARTSAFEFKGQNRDVEKIGQQLHATHLIEGSVRKAGNRLRITVQLVKADDGTHIWSESYDRELTDIFAVQEDIARAITASLRMPLGLKPGENLVSSRTANLDSYQDYLRARALMRARGTASAQAIEILEPLVARDPGFAPAWGLLSLAYQVNFLATLDQRLWRRSVEETRRIAQAPTDKAENAAREAIRLDPRYAGGYSALGEMEQFRNHWAAAEDLYRQALALDPNDNETIWNYGNLFAQTGRLKEFLRLAQQAEALEPFMPINNINLADAWLANGQPDSALQVVNGFAFPDVAFGLAKSVRAMAYADEGRFNEAADTVLKAARNKETDNTEEAIQAAAKLLRSAPAKVKAPKNLPVLPARMNFIYAYVGAPGRMMDMPERALEAGIARDVRWIFDPAYAQTRKTERFKTWARKIGLVDYWRARGWPDLCHPVGAGDFVCG